MLSWISNVGEAFLSQHRDMGLDVSYVSDYVDNHQLMDADLKENRIELDRLKENSDVLIKTIQDEEEIKNIRKNMEIIEQKWSKLEKSVEKRIAVSSDYLQFIKLLNQYRNLSLDLQELFKTFANHSISSNIENSDNLFEQHVQEKMLVFEKLYKELLQKGQVSVELLKNVSFKSFNKFINYIHINIKFLFKI